MHNFKRSISRLMLIICRIYIVDWNYAQIRSALGSSLIMRFKMKEIRLATKEEEIWSNVKKYVTKTTSASHLHIARSCMVERATSKINNWQDMSPWNHELIATPTIDLVILVTILKVDFDHSDKDYIGILNGCRLAFRTNLKYLWNFICRQQCLVERKSPNSSNREHVQHFR